MKRALALCMAAALSAPVYSADPTAPELAAALQRHYETIRDFSADFRHTSRGVLGRETIERGTLVVKKPGKMRFEYRAPEQKLFVTDGTTMYEYIPEMRQLNVREVPKTDDGSTPVLFLSGRGNLVRDFTPSFTGLPADIPKESRALKLVPKNPQVEYESLVLIVDARTLALRGLTALDGQGGTSSFVFTNLRENINPPDQQFQFTPPRGVDIYKQPSR